MQEYFVEQILEMKADPEGQLLYKMKWKDWPVETATWEPSENMIMDPISLKKLVRNMKDRAKRAKEKERTQLAGNGTRTWGRKVLPQNEKKIIKRKHWQLSFRISLNRAKLVSAYILKNLQSGSSFKLVQFISVTTNREVHIYFELSQRTSFSENFFQWHHQIPKFSSQIKSSKCICDIYCRNKNTGAQVHSQPPVDLEKLQQQRKQHRLKKMPIVNDNADEKQEIIPLKSKLKELMKILRK